MCDASINSLTAYLAVASGFLILPYVISSFTGGGNQNSVFFCTPEGPINLFSIFVQSAFSERLIM